MRGVSGTKVQICCVEGGTFFDAVTTPPSLPYPSSPPPISHLMCGGCWESHAKMNNNRLLVTIEHEHTRRLSHSLPLALCRLPSHLLSLLSPWHAHKQHFLCDLRTHRDSISPPLSLCVSLSLPTHHSETLTFGLKVIPHIPLFHTALMTRYQCGW